MLASATGVAVIGAAGLLLRPISLTLRRMQESVGVAPPTKAMLAQENHGKCVLLRRVPVLKDKIAYRQLGSNFPTPVHESTVMSPSGTKLRFCVKREDLSSDLYGGNKVRAATQVDAWLTPNRPWVRVLPTAGAHVAVPACGD